MTNPTPINPDALEAGAKAMYETMSLPGDWSWEKLRGDQAYHRDIAQSAVSAYLAVAQPVVNSMEELITTRAGLALANAAFNEGLSAGIRACNESLEGEPFVKPVSPYRSEVDE